MDVKKYIGSKIREKRKSLKWNQEILSSYLGMSRVAVALIETGKNSTTSEHLWKICNALHCTPNDLFPPTDKAKWKEAKIIKKTIILE